MIAQSRAYPVNSCCSGQGRAYTGPMSDADSMTVFNRRRVRAHRDRAAAGWDGFNFLKAEVVGRLVERLADIKREFRVALDLGCHGGEVAQALAAVPSIAQVVATDLSPRFAAEAAQRMPGLPTVAADEEFLPFAEGSFDLVVSALSLHWVNDLPGALIQVRRALKPDGLFLGAILGGETLFELRRSLMEAEMDLMGGLSPRISPMAEVRDAGGLLQRAGFALPVVDSDMLTVSYPHAFRLIQDLRGMGETNAALDSRKAVSPSDLFTRAAERYQDLYPDGEGGIEASFQVLYLAGWAPDESQQKPLRRGSAKLRLADALGTEEINPLKN
ncbi:methyltransferase family protein [Nitrospirillum viridazoti]|uniref:Methyltransferase family protein n=2 Tax=Nitrospirillum TaxID=1543705 RepID=A0A560HK59_9PROT|nr:methyltransferase family protein [Nitrospirillum amazonense]